MYIPHNFGFQQMKNFIINTEDDLKKKMSLVSDLIDIKAAYKVAGTSLNLKKKKSAGSNGKLPNPIDEDYEKLKCSMLLLSNKEKEYKMLEEYVKNRSENRSIKIIDAFKIARQGEF